MSKKLTFENLSEIANSRNHIVVSMGNYCGVQSKVDFFCNICQSQFTTSVASYKNSKSGCPSCKRLSISLAQSDKVVSESTRQLISNKAKGRKGSLKGKYGKSHPAFKGTLGRDFKNPTTEYYIWREAVKAQSNRQCVLSGQTSQLVAHHLDSWNSCPEGRFDPANGVLLSREIHTLFHKLYGFGNNTKEQFKQFALDYFGKAISSQALSTLKEGSETTGEVKPS